MSYLSECNKSQLHHHHEALEVRAQRLLQGLQEKVQHLHRQGRQIVMKCVIKYNDKIFYIVHISLLLLIH